MYHFKAYVFKGKRTAQEALQTIDKYDRDAIWVDHLAIISRNRHGKVSVYSTWVHEKKIDEKDMGLGALTGMAVGALLGPAGVIVGLLGGSAAGHLVGSNLNLELKDTIFEAFAKSLHYNTSAIVVLSEASILDKLTNALGNPDAEIFQTEMNEADVEQLKKALEKV